MITNAISVSSVFHQAGSPIREPSAATLMLSPLQKGMSQPPKKKTVTSIAVVIRCPYSPIMKTANFMEEYSVWYPPTSSASASGRSKGSRFVSARPVR